MFHSSQALDSPLTFPSFVSSDEDAKPGLSTIGLKRPEGPGLDPAKRRRVLRFVIR